MVKRLLSVLLVIPGLLQAAQDRISAPVDRARTVKLRGNVRSEAAPLNDRGAADPAMRIDRATLLLKPAAGIEAFLARQHLPGSPAYRQWLTPEQFGDRFGLSDNDLVKVRAWLESEGLKIDQVARGRHWIAFSGTAAQAARTFHTEFRRYSVNGRMHFSNATAPEIPAALEPVVGGFLGLNDFPVRSPIVRPQNTLPDGSHVLAPEDLATIYNVTPLYAGGIDGTGQKIAIAGAVALDLADIRAFRKMFGLRANDPDTVLVGRDPGPNADDLGEADLDVEWAGAIAPNAKIVYVYAADPFTAAAYAVDQNLASVVSLSFGECEAFAALAYRGIAQQANAQGITYVASSGDQGAATCDARAPVPQASKGARAAFPASVPEITAVGGTMFNEGAGQYWAASNSSTGGSALSYIPEVAWNETAANGVLLSSGGGASGFYSKPFWQTGPGVPDDRARDIPDLSLTAATHDAYLVISSGKLFGVAGTSASAPSFAAILALLNQSLVQRKVLAQPGLGNINPELYRLAQSNSEAFHDIITGDNIVPCTQSSLNCVEGGLGYAAGPGYDLATGLGSIDAAKLVAAWGKGAPISVTLSATPSKAGLTDTVKLTATMKTSGPAPVGVITFVTSLDQILGSSPLTDSTATLTVDGQAVLGGTGAVYALYSGDSVYGSAAGSAVVQPITPVKGSFVVATLTPNPSYAIAGSAAVDIVLTEKAGVATRLTSATGGGAPISVNGFFGGGSIAANGSLTASLAFTPSLVPANLNFHFVGQDADGTVWTRDVPLQVINTPGPAIAPAIELFSSPTTVAQNPQADRSCQWSHQIAVRETGGFYVYLSSLRQGSTDLSGSLQQLFGTTRLAPFGTLAATICLPSTSTTGARNYQIAGTSEAGTTVTASVSVTYTGVNSNAAAMTASVKSINLAVAGASGAANGSLDVSFTGGNPQWSAVAFPDRPSWLTITGGGVGTGKVTIAAAPSGLSRGVYTATVAIQSANALPQVIFIPVTLVVGNSTSISIAGVSHGASFKPVFAPGMVLSVFGTRLSPATIAASSLPLPLSMAGVSATVNGVAAPFYFVSPGQLNIQVPYEAGAGPAVLAVNNNGQVTSFPFQITPMAPGIFTGTGGALVPFASGKAGDTLLAFITGDGDLTPTIATGATPPASTAISRLPKPRQAVTVTIGGTQAPIAFAGLPPGLAGVTQINFTVPAGIKPGVYDVIVTVGGIDSAPAKVTVQP